MEKKNVKGKFKDKGYWIEVAGLSRLYRRSGFTLLELIVVIFVMGIIFAFAVPQFSGRIIRDNTEVAVNWICLNTAKLKKEARIQGKTLMMCIQKKENTIRIRAARTPGLSGEKQRIKTYVLPGDVTIEAVEFKHRTENPSGACIRFHKKGFCDHALIRLSDTRGQTLSLEIRPFLETAIIHEGHIQFEPDDY